jgi:hypothetical protein
VSEIRIWLDTVRWCVSHLMPRGQKSLYFTPGSSESSWLETISIVCIYEDPLDLFWVKLFGYIRQGPGTTSVFWCFTSTYYINWYQFHLINEAVYSRSSNARLASDASVSRPSGVISESRDFKRALMKSSAAPRATVSGGLLRAWISG